MTNKEMLKNKGIPENQEKIISIVGIVLILIITTLLFFIDQNRLEIDLDDSIVGYWIEQGEKLLGYNGYIDDKQVLIPSFFFASVLIYFYRFKIAFHSYIFIRKVYKKI